MQFISLESMCALRKWNRLAKENGTPEIVAAVSIIIYSVCMAAWMTREILAPEATDGDFAIVIFWILGAIVASVGLCILVNRRKTSYVLAMISCGLSVIIGLFMGDWLGTLVFVAVPIPILLLTMRQAWFDRT